MDIALADLGRADLALLVEEHLADMRAASPPESVHALSAAGLAADRVTVWTIREDDVLLGCCALQELGPGPGEIGPGGIGHAGIGHAGIRHGEIKSMRTARAGRNRGVGTLMLDHLLAEARRRGYHRVSLETGAQDFFAPARRLYRRNGFTECPPFADYRLDPNSVYLSRLV